MIDDIKGGSFDIEVWKKPYEEAGAVVIPDEVEKLRNAFFAEDITLTSISANAVKEIGNYTFNNCTGLTTAIMPELKTTGIYAFGNCSNLTTINLPVLETIGDYAFYKTSNLTNLTLGNNFKSIGSYAFSESHSITFQASQFNTLEYVGNYALKLNKNKTYHYLNGNIVFSKNISICTQSFGQVMGDYTIKFLNGGTIGTSAFWNANGLKKIDLTGITSIGNNAFEAAYYLNEVTFGDSVLTIPQSCFKDCIALSTVNFNNTSNIITINNKAFEGATALENIVFSGSVDLQGGCFVGSNIKSITFSNDYSNIWHAEGHFKECTKLATINNFKYSSTSNSMFAGCTALKTFNFSTITRINGSSFERSGLTHAELPNRITFYNAVTNYSAFGNCNELTWLGLPLGFDKTGDKYYYKGICTNCTKLRKVYVKGDSDFSVGNQSSVKAFFNGCSSNLIIYTDCSESEVNSASNSKWNYINDTTPATTIYNTTYEQFLAAVNADEECIK